MPKDLPPALEARFGYVAGRLAAVDSELPPDLAESAPRVLATSGFVVETLVRQPASLIARLTNDARVSRPLLDAALDLDDDASEADFMSRLRLCRNVELAAIAWRDIGGLADLDRSLADLSGLADGLIEIALEKAVGLLEPRFGRPGPLLVLAMGKLGGRELNFSSDVDLILLFPDAHDEAGDSASYYLRLAQRLIKLLEERTAAGFVYRVDTRLRPFGKSGPLALSIGALETYLVQHGRDWERYAYIKARLVTGAEYTSELFDQVLTPFVYRRYLDFGVFEAMRQMKQLISQDVARREQHDNIKLGRGGIREVEFIAQVFQLLRGGQAPSLRARGLLPVLAELKRLGVFEVESAEELAASYRLLRVTENRLQALEDRQTHELPTDPEVRARLAYAMSCPGWPELAALVERHRDCVQGAFDELDWEGTSDTNPETEAARLAFAGAELGATAGDAFEPLDQLRDSALYRRMDEISRQRLAAFVGVLVPRLEQHAQAAEIVARIMPVIRAVCRRSAYLSLLLENPAALDRLISLAAQSAMLARLVAEHPILLDELLDSRLLEAAPTRAEIETALERQMHGVEPDDVERQLEALRNFQRASLFRVAIADRFGGLPLMKVSDRLTDIAELVIDFALRIAQRELEQKHGRPMHGTRDALRESGLIVVAYGKLGGLELGYGSDLDLVFLHDSEGEVQESTGPSVIDNQRYFVRLVQRVIHYLSVQTTSGRLYEIDTRLRPDGASGLLVSSLTAFARYQREDAWTWEHQALLRSRSVAGPASLRTAFEQARVVLLTEAVRRKDLKADVTAMRRRMRKELAQGTADRFDIKQDAGGLADIEFLIDYWVLANADRYPSLVEYPDNVRQLEALEVTALVPAATCASLKADYLALRAETHALALSDGGRTVAPIPFEALRERVRSLWQETFGEPPD